MIGNSQHLGGARVAQWRVGWNRLDQCLQCSQLRLSFRELIGGGVRATTREVPEPGRNLQAPAPVWVR